MSNIDVRIDTGRIDAFVSELEEANKDKAIRGGLLRGAKVLERVGRMNLRQRNNEHTGNLMKSMRAKLARRQLKAYAGFERSYRLNLEKGVGNHAHLVDKGTVERYTKKGSYRGIMPASYFWEDTKQNSTNEVRRAIGEGVEEYVRRLTEKYA